MKWNQIIFGVLLGIVIMGAVWYIVTPNRKVSREGFQQTTTGTPGTTGTAPSGTAKPALETCSIMKSIRERIQTNYDKAKSTGFTAEQIGHYQIMLDNMASEMAKNNCPV
jgi:hypothetical protein